MHLPAEQEAGGSEGDCLYASVKVCVTRPLLKAEPLPSPAETKEIKQEQEALPPQATSMVTATSNIIANIYADKRKREVAAVSAPILPTPLV
jgi:hypothetical protein